MKAEIAVRRAACLLLVAIAAKTILVGLRAADGAAAGLLSPWAPAAMLYQDVWLALAVLALDLALLRIGLPRAGWGLYAVVAAIVAANVPIARQLGTPLTWPLVAAAGGALRDSLAAHATLANALACAAVLACAIAAPRAIRSAPRGRPALALALALAAVLALGPAGVRRCETLGLHRNAVVALMPARPTHMSFSAGSEGHVSHVMPEGAALDLSHLAGAARGRSVMWVLLESTGARYLRLHGAALDPTPRLTALAARGVVFESAYTSYPESIKSLYALLCGRAPAPETAAADYDAARARCDALPALLRAHGRRTGLFHSGRFVYLGMRHLIDGRGFDALHDAQTIGGPHAVSFGTDDASTVDRLLQWIDEAPERPFFAMYMPIAGHHPYRSPGAGARPFPAEGDLDHYRNDLHAGDEALGRLIDGLAARGRLDDVMWVFQGDHGEAFRQHPGNVAHSLFVYEENVHVPLVVVPPPDAAPAATLRAPQVAGAIDAPPTLLALLGIPPPESWEGRSLLAPEPGVARFFSDHVNVLLGLRTGRWKCVVEPARGRVQLFDLAADPDETRDLAPAEPGRARACEVDLIDWAARVRARLGARSTGPE